MCKDCTNAVQAGYCTVSAWNNVMIIDNEKQLIMKNNNNNNKTKQKTPNKQKQKTQPTTEMINRIFDH